MYVNVILDSMPILPPRLARVAQLLLIVSLALMLVHVLHVLLGIKLTLPQEHVLFSLVLLPIVILVLPILLPSANPVTLASVFKQQVLHVFLSVAIMQ